MARKRNKQNRPAPNFSANPFKPLKGFAVSGPAEAPGTVVPPANDEVSQAAAQDVADETELFAREMARLGLDHVDAEDEEVASVAAPQTPTEVDHEAADFLDAMRELRVDFQDEIPVAPAPPQTSARRERQLRRGQLSPEAELDLHGLTRDAAREKVRFFLADARFQGLRTVLIITGRGHGSAGEPVLRNEVERLLRSEVGASVLEWTVAPRRFGGAGALVAFLKKQ